MAKIECDLERSVCKLDSIRMASEGKCGNSVAVSKHVCMNDGR